MRSHELRQRCQQAAKRHFCWTMHLPALCDTYQALFDREQPL
jgi:hypothetical protein